MYGSNQYPAAGSSKPRSGAAQGSFTGFGPPPSGASTPATFTPPLTAGHAQQYAAQQLQTQQQQSSRREAAKGGGEAIQPGPLSVTKVFKQYYSKAEVKRMLAAQTTKVQPARVPATREQACVFMDKVGVRLGFPRRTIACAQLLYHRFHLHFPLQDFSPYDVSISSLLLASKLEDTLKKLREIQAVGWQIRNSTLTEPDPSLLEPDRSKLVGIERLILETMCFDFGAGRPVNGKDAFGYVVAIGRHMSASKEYVKIAFRICVDSYRTLAGLTYPPHVIALASLWLASFLDPKHSNSRRDSLAADSAVQPPVEAGEVKPDLSPGWERLYEAEIEDIEDIALSILDLYEYLMKQVPPDLVAATARANASTATFSPQSPADAHPQPSSAPAPTPSTQQPSVSLPQSLTDISKIQIRLREEGAKSRARVAEEQGDDERVKRRKPSGPATRESGAKGEKGGANEVLGRDDVTVRFVFGAAPQDSPTAPPTAPVGF